MENDLLKEEKKEKKSKKLKAKKDFVIFQNEYKREIKEGDDLSDIPKRFIENLKTEKVI